MFGLGVPELIFILVAALLLFGPRKLPEIGRTLGRGMAEFRRASNELKRSLDAELIEEELRETKAAIDQHDPRRYLREVAGGGKTAPSGGKRPPPADVSDGSAAAAATVAAAETAAETATAADDASAGKTAADDTTRVAATVEGATAADDDTTRVAATVEGATAAADDTTSAAADDATPAADPDAERPELAAPAGTVARGSRVAVDPEPDPSP